MSLADLRAWAATDHGRRRKHNEDAFLIDADLGLYVVCDGMGGFKRGDVASQLACSVVQEALAGGKRTLELHRHRPTDTTLAAVRALLESAVQRACEEIYLASTALTGDGGRMGTTLDAVLLLGTQVFTAHVGDGRIYLIRRGEAHQVTEDHSLVQQQVREGLLTPEDARKARNRNVITRALGVFPSVLVDLLHFDIGVGDTLLLCSDGLHGYLGTRELVRAVEDGQDGGCTAMVAQANARGGKDNITALVLQHRGSRDPDQQTSLAPSEALDTLRRCDLFSFCTYRELVSVATHCEWREVPATTVLFREDDPGEECFVIAEGEVEVFRGGVTLARLGPGAYFGEMSFIDSPRRSASVTTVDACRFLVLSRNDFLQMVNSDGRLASKLMWRLLHHLSRMVRNTNSRLLAGLTTQELDSIELDEG